MSPRFVHKAQEGSVCFVVGGSRRFDGRREQKVGFYMETTNVLLFLILLVLIINALFVMALMFEEN